MPLLLCRVYHTKGISAQDLYCCLHAVSDSTVAYVFFSQNKINLRFLRQSATVTVCSVVKESKDCWQRLWIYWRLYQISRLWGKDILKWYLDIGFSIDFLVFPMILRNSSSKCRRLYQVTLHNRFCHEFFDLDSGCLVLSKVSCVAKPRMQTKYFSSNVACWNYLSTISVPKKWRPRKFYRAVLIYLEN
jgi:hypothetical protein